jgi:GNAT superfamily N-acetyltransferase
MSTSPGLLDGFDGPRACGPWDLAGVLDLANLVLRTLGTPPGGPPRRPTIGYDYTHIYHPDNLDNIRIICRDGVVVSSAAIYPNTVRTPRGEIRVGGINAVVTHPDFRRYGLATAVMEDAAAKMRADGLHVGLLGTGIVDWYRKLAWELAGRQQRFLLDRGNIAFLPLSDGLDVTDEWRSCAEELCALHNAEPIGAARSLSLFTLLAARKLSRLFVARRGGRVVAYAGVGGTAVREYAGAPEDVAALLRAVFACLDNPDARTSERSPGQRSTITMSVTTPAAEEGLPGLLQERGIPSAMEYHGMLLISDAPALFDALSLRDMTLERRDPGWRLCHDSHSLDVTERELVKLVFGPERWPGFAAGIFPVDFYQWPLDHV